MPSLGVDFIDVVNGHLLSPGGTNVVSALGRVGNGVQIAPFTYPTDKLQLSFLDAGLGLTSSIAMCGWVKPTAAGVLQVGLTFPSSVFFSSDYTFTTGSATLSRSAATVTRSCPTIGSTWHFFYQQFNAATGKVGLSFDGDAVVESSGTATAGASATSCYYTPATGTNIYLDELAIFAQILSADQIATLYNAGAGRTWPF